MATREVVLVITDPESIRLADVYRRWCIVFGVDPVDAKKLAVLWAWTEEHERGKKCQS